jgi:hypothetical protein
MADLAQQVLESGYTADELIIIGLNVVKLCGKTGAGDSVISELSSIRKMLGEATATGATVNAPANAVLAELKDLKQMMGASANRGKVAENMVMATLVRSFPSDSIDRVASEAGMCDIMLSDGDVRVAIEVKNYEINVPGSQVKKFERDLMAMDITAGIMISCKTGIAGVAGQFAYKMLGAKLAIYLSNGDDGLAVVWAVLFIKATMSMMKRLAVDNTGKVNPTAILLFIEAKLETIRECIADNYRMRESIAKMKATMLRTLDNSVEELTHGLNLSKSRLQGLVDGFGEYIATGAVPVLPVLPTVAKPDVEVPLSVSQPKKKPIANVRSIAELRKEAEALGISTKGMTKGHLAEVLSNIQLSDKREHVEPDR